MEASQIIVNWTQTIFIGGTMLVSALIPFITLKVNFSNLEKKVDAIDIDLKDFKKETENKIIKQDKARQELKDIVIRNKTDDEVFITQVRAEFKSQSKTLEDYLIKINTIIEKYDAKFQEYDRNISEFFRNNPDLK